MSQPPPKPWESSSTTTNIPGGFPSSSSQIGSISNTLIQEDALPVVPDLPENIDTIRSINMNSRYGNSLNPNNNSLMNRYGTTSPYGYTGRSYGDYGSGYGSYGSYGSYGGSYNSYGGGYGNSYGSPYNNKFSSGYGGGLYGGGLYGNNTGMMGPPIAESTQRAFHVVDQVVQAFGSFAHMLDSALHATHSTFMAILGLAEHFGHLKSYIGQAVSIFALFAGLQKLLSKINSPLSISSSHSHNNNNNISAEQFLASHSSSSSYSISKRKSRTPWINIFLMIGSPIFIWILLRRYFSKKKLDDNTSTSQSSSNSSATAPSATIIPSKTIEICRAKYDFRASGNMQLAFKKGDLIAILNRIQNSDGTSSWWHGRLENGQSGIFPANYVELLKVASSSDENAIENPI